MMALGKKIKTAEFTMFLIVIDYEGNRERSKHRIFMTTPTFSTTVPIVAERPATIRT
jgi:hypothetical protein